MFIKDTGVLKSSQMFLHISSEFAKEALFLLPIIGKFNCTSLYQVDRKMFENYFLLLFVDEGEMKIKFRETEAIAKPSSVILLDCREPHAYGACGDVTFHYFHFMGNSSEKYFNFLYQRYGCIFYPHSVQHINLQTMFDQLFEIAQAETFNEHFVSVLIHSILAEITELNTYKIDAKYESIQKAISYIEKHYTEELSIKELAKQFSISQFYFIRLFRQITTMPPYTYINYLRICLAKQLLSTSSQSIEHIAQTCGFSSIQIFNRSFKKYTQQTPGQFRKHSVIHH